MTTTTRTIREQGFQPLECDIPAGLTIAEYRARHRKRGVGDRDERPVGRMRLARLIRHS
jgi:hypothetical protein